MSKVGADSEFKDGFLEGAARIFFVSAYADYVEEYDVDNVFPKPGGGEDWGDYAPETPKAAYALAGELWAALEAANKVSVYVLAQRAAEADGAEVDPEEFGSDLAMQYMGHGVSWFDDHAEFKMKVPHGEVGAHSFDEATLRGFSENPRAPRLSIDDTEIHTWFERDRAHVELRNKKNDKTIAEWWDDDVQQAIEDGFLDRRNLHRSAFDYAKEVGLVR